MTKVYNSILEADPKLVPEKIWELCYEEIKSHSDEIVFLSKIAILIIFDFPEKEIYDRKCESFYDCLILLSKNFNSLYKACALEFCFTYMLNDDLKVLISLVKNDFAHIRFSSDSGAFMKIILTYFLIYQRSSRVDLPNVSTLLRNIIYKEIKEKSNKKTYLNYLKKMIMFIECLNV